MNSATVRRFVCRHRAVIYASGDFRATADRCRRFVPATARLSRSSVSKSTYIGSTLTIGVSAGGFETNAQLLTGMPAASTLAISLSVRATGAGNLFGVYIFEEILAAGDLP